MKFERTVFYAICLGYAFVSSGCGFGTLHAELVDEVNPFIGCITQDDSSIHGLGKTFPGAATPCGMVQLSPDTITGGDNGPGYSWRMDTIEGFSFTHLSGVGWYGEFGNFQVMPSTGQRQFDREKVKSAYSHDSETAEPGYYAVTLDRYGIRAEMTAAPRAGMLRFTFPKTERVRIQIDLGRRIGQKERWLKHSRQYVKVVDDRTIEGHMYCTYKDGGWGRGGGKVDYTQHFRCVFSRPFAAFGAWEKHAVVETVREFTGTNTGFFAEFDVKAGEQVMLRAGFSYVDEAGAWRNLEHDMPDFDFDAARDRAHDLWRDAFDGIRIEGGTKEERSVFATALYHSLIDPRMVSDCDRRYMGSDGKVYGSADFTMRTVFSGWDVFRSEFPLLTLIRPDIVNDTINSMLRWNELGPRDTLPVWDVFGCLSSCMIGNPIIPCMADAYEKGIRNWPVETAWRLAEVTSSRRSNQPYGWTPGSLSSTLEYAFDDWCMGRLAQMLGKHDRVRYYYVRSQSYTNCWSKEVGWMRSRNADGSWLPWRGRKVHGQGCVESNPYQQGWFVPHDAYGLMRLMGGRARFADELEKFFDGVPPDFLWNDYYNHANEPVHHVPFLFPYCGKPWLTQKWTREICAKAYRNDIRGLCGNDDVGQMSAWYVLAASGLHPVAPGSGVWILTSPVFAKVSIRLDPRYYRGGTFTISAPMASAKNRYIRRVRLNGKELHRAWLATAEVSGGGILELDMGNEPEIGYFKAPPPDVSGVR